MFSPQLRVNQDEPMEEYLAQLGEIQALNEGQASLASLSGPGLPCKEQMRTNVINEIMNTEQDYIKHLKDICEVWTFCHSDLMFCYFLSTQQRIKLTNAVQTEVHPQRAFSLNGLIRFPLISCSL